MWSQISWIIESVLAWSMKKGILFIPVVIILPTDGQKKSQ
jgi:hypothetical protein